MSTRIGFLSFGHWMQHPDAAVRTARDALLQSIDLAVAAEEIGIDGAYFRVHHFAEQLGSPFPLLAAAGARTSRIELGTGVIDMRYEPAAAFAENAGAADLIAGGRLQLGVSRGSPETVVDGFLDAGNVPAGDEDHAGMARRRTAEALRLLRGGGLGRPNRGGQFTPPAPSGDGSGLISVQPLSPGLDRRLWWGAGSRATAEWTAEQGMNLMSSTLLTEDTGVPLGDLQAEQIQVFRDAWKEAGWDWEPRVSISRSIMPIIDDETYRFYGMHAQAPQQDQVGRLEGGFARFGRSYAGTPDRIAEELRADAAVQEADTLLVTVPNMLGVEFNARILRAIHEEIRPALG